MIKPVRNLLTPSVGSLARWSCIRAFSCGLIATALPSLPIQAAADEYNSQQLADLSLEDLAKVQVTSVSKRAQPISSAAASIYVISNHDIHRAGVTTLPEALRLAPNLQVAQLDAHDYAISARGFNSLFANKLLVLIDGRTVYSPLFSGVFWDAQDVVLEDIDQIEVISGPGATLWGANAVNGVINITTRTAADTQGGLVSLGTSADESQVTARYGAAAADGHFRLYAKHSQHDDVFDTHGVATLTGWQRTQTGFRADWGDTGDGFTIQGDAYSGETEQPEGDGDIELRGANILSRYSRRLSENANLSVQGYFDHTQRHLPAAGVERLNTLDLELKHGLKVGDIHYLMWGAGHRFAADRIDSAGAFTFFPEKVDLRWTNAFVQDEIRLNADTKLTLGSKMEHNPYTGWEFLPNVRLAWMAEPRQLLWAGWSRSVRSPSRVDRGFHMPVVPPAVDGVPQYVVAGGPDFVSEVTKVSEIGYRAQLIPELSFSLTAFYSTYDQLRTLEPNPNGSGLIFLNKAFGDGYGLEGWSTWRAAPNWRLRGGFLRQRFDLNREEGSQDSIQTSILESHNPDYQWLLRSSHTLFAGVELDATLRHVDALEDKGIASYTALDARLGWSLQPNLELSLTGRNLLDSAHREFSESEYRRSVYVKLVWTL